MTRWIVTIEVWPHSTGNGNEADQKAAGNRVNTFAVDADCMREAVKLANAIAQGMEAHPMVWRAPITGIVKEQ